VTESAVRVLEAQPIAVALCDVLMPGAGGVWLAEQVSARFPTTAIIYATAVDSLPQDRYSIPGVLGYLVKPIDTDALLETVAMGMAWHRVAAKRGSRGGEVAGEGEG
jgi:DNA-binding NtrC family response regulator